jgi:hypothetical protein
MPALARASERLHNGRKLRRARTAIVRADWPPELVHLRKPPCRGADLLGRRRRCRLRRRRDRPLSDHYAGPARRRLVSAHSNVDIIQNRRHLSALPLAGATADSGGTKHAWNVGSPRPPPLMGSSVLMSSRGPRARGRPASRPAGRN